MSDQSADEETVESPDETLTELFARIEDRRETLPEDSYTASLFTHEKGEDAILEKLGEESTELVLAAKNDDETAIREESADLVYHLLVLLAAEGVSLDELQTTLRERF
ncbi:MAG: phosphoribosyl-ATP pyrophosphohydrolase [halophilic archaeon J07HB67]|nr:MAG: phosphoribosyl-ATP pyrophosphohydrolase [halophilic archaeon J07HB67]